MSESQRPDASRGRGRLKFKILIGVVLAVVVAWSAVWFAAASVFERRLDRALAAAADNGTAVLCEERGIDGFPFRLELRCGEGSRIVSPDLAATLGGITGVALVYDPTNAIVELASPARIEAPVEGTAEWALAHGSLALGRGGAEEVRFEVEEATVTGRRLPWPLTADLAGLYLRPVPGARDDLDVGAKLAGFKVLAEATPLDVRAHLLVPDGAGILAGDMASLDARARDGGLPITVDQLLMTAGAATVSVGGTIVVRPDGLLDGDLDVALALPGGDLPDLGILPEAATRAAGRLLGNVLAIAPRTTIGETPARKVSLRIRAGRVSAGLIPLGRIPAMRVVAGG